MKRSWFTEEQIIGVFKEQEAGTPAVDVCRKHGIMLCHLLQLEGQVWRVGGIRRPQVEGAFG
ncbi:MAG: transposase [Planctomycetales bacterium]|nr:transposase [Planctomycetales bacterium]